MAFVKPFMSKRDGWKDTYLTEAEEQEVIEESEAEHVKIIERCFADARTLAKSDKNVGKILWSEDRITTVAIALFDKRARHTQYLREARAKKNFDRENK